MFSPENTAYSFAMGVVGGLIFGLYLFYDAKRKAGRGEQNDRKLALQILLKERAATWILGFAIPLVLMVFDHTITLLHMAAFSACATLAYELLLWRFRRQLAQDQRLARQS